MAVVTITGAGGVINSITLDTAQTTALAQQIAKVINTAATALTLHAVDLPGSPPLTPGPGVNEAVVPSTAVSGSFIGPAGFGYVVDAATVPVTVTAATGQAVVAGNAGITFNAVGTDTLVAGGGATAVNLSGGSNIVTLADGSSTIDAGTSTATTINAGSGAVTMFGSTSGNTVFLSSGTNDVIEGTGSDTLIAGSGADTIFGNVGRTLTFGGSGPMTFIAGTGVSTVVGGATGPTLFGSTGSDVVYAGASGGLYVAGDGNETLNASTSTGPNALYGGSFLSSTSVVTGGSGADTLVGGPGLATLAGGAGDNVFAFLAAHGGGVNVIQDFTANDLVLLDGYGPNGITSTTVAGGSTTLTLSDNTQISFVGVTSLDMSKVIQTPPMV